MQIVKPCLEDARMTKEQVSHVVLVGGSMRIPKVQELLQQLFGGKKLCKTINPDEVVAYGVALQVVALNNKGVHLVPMDVTPLSLGLAKEGGVMSIVVPINMPIPLKKDEYFTTVIDNVTRVPFSVYEGERSIVRDNNLLGKFFLSGIPTAICGVPLLKVVFEVDLDGILKVSVKDVISSVSDHIVIVNDYGRLIKEEIERMLGDAERF